MKESDGNQFDARVGYYWRREVCLENGTSQNPFSKPFVGLPRQAQGPRFRRETGINEAFTQMATNWILRDKALTSSSNIVTSKTLRLFCFPQAGAGAWVFHGWQERLSPFVEVRA